MVPVVLYAALLGMTLAAPSAALADDSSDALMADAMRLLGARTYVASAEAWTVRNRAINDRAVQVIEAVGTVSPEQRAAMNRAGDQMIRKDIQGRPDPRAFCRTLPGKLDSGIIDVEKRDDLRGPLQRVMAYPLPKS